MEQLKLVVFHRKASIDPRAKLPDVFPFADYISTSKNVVLTQIWIALCVYLLLAFLKFKAKIDLSKQQMLRLLQLNLFERRNLLALLKPPEIQLIECRQFSLF